MLGADLPDLSSELPAEDQARKICLKYRLGPQACEAMVQCAKEGDLQSCWITAVAAAATGACAYFGAGEWSGLCGRLAAKFAGMVGTTGTIAGCTFGQLARDLPGDLTDAEILEDLIPGEYAAGPFDDGLIKVYVMTYYGSNCPSYLPENVAKDIDFLEWHINRQPGVQLFDYYRAAKDWNGKDYVLRRVRDSRDPSARVRGKWVYVPRPIMVDPVSQTVAPLTLEPIMTDTIYPSGTVAVYDGQLKQFILVTPAE